VRNFCIVPGFLLAADQKADEVRLFALDPEKGSIGECLSVLSIPAPVCIIAG
jgi:6-phosphogluconolactonase (cycloisomerase 2 family)